MSPIQGDPCYPVILLARLMLPCLIHIFFQNVTYKSNFHDTLLHAKYYLEIIVQCYRQI